ncbi:glycosyl hydrolase family 18 protein [Chitinophaga rhizophila]|uniref:Chitinase II/V-like catalytic domain-containing protein n=1 Tax=Chitinophaga rhizophila TaxID=2866212 RepID=A0ABS7GK30_9BACT|nr:glycosyl hydrolase family 18 protein [Chitinophaga rhizophila]MBW8686803.1 hypothetical protein [Chitinophaga rhizophila]
MYSLYKNILRIFLFLNISLFTGTKMYAFGVYTSAYDTTQPKQTIQLPEFRKDTTGKVKLLQKIVSALQFRRNAHAREQQRVITIIRTVMADSLVATAADIKKLNEELSLQQNQHFDSLRALIDKILQRPDPVPTSDEGTEASEASPQPVSDADVASLINKIIPILQQKETIEQNTAAQQQRLQKIRSLYGRSPFQVDTLKLSDTTGITYTVRLAHKCKVMGIHPYWMGEKYLHYNFSTLSELNYYGYTPAEKKEPIPNELPLVDLAANRTFTFYMQDAARIEALLHDASSQLRCADTLMTLLLKYEAHGVNIWFGSMPSTHRKAFTNFITLLYNHLNNGSRHYRVAITIPPYDETGAYDLRALDQVSDHFLVDFTKAIGSAAGPLSPMKGDARKAIEPVISRLLNQQIKPAKFILLLSYYGTEWKLGADGRDLFTRYVSYSDIKKRFPADSMVSYDEDAVAAVVHQRDAAGIVRSAIWFDDANTLEVKYDYILNSGLGGVAVWPLGADDGYGELWDVMTDKFVQIDTTFLDTVPLVPRTEPTMSWWSRVMHKLSHELRMLKLMFSDPCQLMEDRQEDDDDFFAYVALFLFCITVLIGIYYAYNLRMKGFTWEWRKTVLRILLGAVFISAFFGIVAVFLNREVPFGMTHKNTDGTRCVTIPLADALFIFAAGIALGILISRFLLRPMMTQEEKP